VRPTWTGKRVIVTGADGFIGSHLVEALVHAGADVTAFCFYNSNGSRGWLDHGPPDIRDACRTCLGDIRDSRFVESACAGMDVVFHLAALIAIPYSYVATESFVATNVHGTMNVLEACRRGGVGRLIQTSTSEVYGTPDMLPISEAHSLKGQSPYSATKIAADKLCEAYFNSFSTPVVILRPFNTYGPRQSARAVIPTILTQLLCGRRCVRLGDVTTRRDLTFVDDTVAGFLAAGLAAGIEGETIQLGTGRSESIGELFAAACSVCEVEATIEQDELRLRPERSEVRVLLSDPSRARERLDWSAAVALEDGMRRTMEWVRENLHYYRPDTYAI
jgi:UDP-glucose 4-epimerase